MAYTLIKSNSLPLVLEKEPALFKNSSVLGRTPYIIAQNKQTALYLQNSLAQAGGICASFRYALIESALRQLIAGFPSLKRKLDGEEGRPNRFPLHSNEIKLILYQYLRAVLIRDEVDEELLALKRYAGNLSDDGSNVKLFQFCSSLASLFTSYGMNLPALTGRWRSGGRKFPGMTEEERWQRHLWRVLFAGDNGYLLLSDLMEEAVAAAELYAGTESRLVLVGSSFIGETALKFFQKVSASADVCHIFITPLGHSSEDNAFCKNYGRIAYDFEKFAATVPSDNIRVYEQPYPSSFLGRLQQKVYRGGGELPPPDDSVLIYACGSKMREIETVKNVLLRLLDSDSSLKPQDIALIAPDINDYEPYIDAVFKRGEDNERRGVLPYNVVDLKQQEAYTEAFLSLLALAGSEFSRRELFALFNNNFFAQANHISDEDKKIWLGFCRQTEIIRAVDSGHKNRLGEEQKPYNTWRYAFEHFMTAIVLGESEIFEFNADDQGVGESIGRLIDLIRRLYNDFYLLDQREYSFAEWIKKLELLMRRYLSINDDENNWALKQVFRNMQETLITVGNFKVLKQQGVLSEDRLSFAVIKSYLSEVSALSERRKGAFLSGGVVCSSLTPMRSIPFRVIVFLGLAGEHFPGGDGHERSFDLSQSLPSGIKAPLFNLSRRTADRFAFLETLMAARERLIFTFQGRELISGATAEPSQALIDLIDYAGFTVSESSPSINRYPFVYHQPLHAFSRENFNKKLPSATYNVAMQQLARRYYMTERQNSFYKVIGHGAPVSVTAGKLAEVLYNPSFYFFKDILQGGMPAEALDEDCEEESFELTYPIKKMLLCRLEALFYSGTGIDVETFFTETFTLLEKKGVIPSSFYAEPVKDELYLLIKEYAAALNFLTAGVFTGGSFCECKAESLDFTLTEAPVNLTAPQLCFYKNINNGSFIFLGVSLTKNTLHAFWEPYIKALFFTSLQQHKEALTLKCYALKVSDKGGGKVQALTFTVRYTPQEAREQLAGFLRFYQAAGCEPLPLDAALLNEILFDKSRAPVTGLLDSYLQAWRQALYKSTGGRYNNFLGAKNYYKLIYNYPYPEFTYEQQQLIEACYAPWQVLTIEEAG